MEVKQRLFIAYAGSANGTLLDTDGTTSTMTREECQSNYPDSVAVEIPLARFFLTFPPYGQWGVLLSQIENPQVINVADFEAVRLPTDNVVEVDINIPSQPAQPEQTAQPAQAAAPVQPQIIVNIPENLINMLVQPAPVQVIESGRRIAKVTKDSDGGMTIVADDAP